MTALRFEIRTSLAEAFLARLQESPGLCLCRHLRKPGSLDRKDLAWSPHDPDHLVCSQCTPGLEVGSACACCGDETDPRTRVTVPHDETPATIASLCQTCLTNDRVDEQSASGVSRLIEAVIEREASSLCEHLANGTVDGRPLLAPRINPGLCCRTCLEATSWLPGCDACRDDATTAPLTTQNIPGHPTLAAHLCSRCARLLPDTAQTGPLPPKVAQFLRNAWDAVTDEVTYCGHPGAAYWTRAEPRIIRCLTCLVHAQPPVLCGTCGSPHITQRRAVTLTRSVTAVVDLCCTCAPIEGQGKP